MDECKWYGRNTIEAYVNEYAKQTEDFLLGVIEEHLTEHGYHQKIEINGANIKAMVEKQIPKKLKTKLCEEEIYNAGGFTRKVKRYFCPVCGSFIEHGKHCYNCGQKLDWSEV